MLNHLKTKLFLVWVTASSTCSGCWPKNKKRHALDLCWWLNIEQSTNYTRYQSVFRNKFSLVYNKGSRECLPTTQQNIYHAQQNNKLVSMSNRNHSSCFILFSYSGAEISTTDKELTNRNVNYNICIVWLSGFRICATIQQKILVFAI